MARISNMIGKLKIEDLDVVLDEIQVINATGKSDEELHEMMLKDPGYKKCLKILLKFKE
jgi:hypothetical protein